MLGTKKPQIKLPNNRDKMCPEWRAAAESPRLNIITIASDPKYSHYSLAGIDIGTRNIFAVSYLDQNRELKQHIAGTLPNWVLEQPEISFMTKVCKEGRGKEWKQKTLFSNVLEDPHAFPQTVSLFSSLRYKFIQEYIRKLSDELVLLLKTEDVKGIVLERHMKELFCPKEDLLSPLKESKKINSKSVFALIVTELINAALKHRLNVRGIGGQNTTKKCCRCGGEINSHDLRKHRDFVKCRACGSIWSRDFNASVNILARGLIAEANGGIEYPLVPLAN